MEATISCMKPRTAPVELCAKEESSMRRTLPPEILEVVMEHYVVMSGEEIRRRPFASQALQRWERFYHSFEPSESLPRSSKDSGKSSVKLGERERTGEKAAGQPSTGPLSLTLVNKQFKDILIPIFYREIILTAPKQIIAFLQKPNPLSYRHITSIVLLDGLDDGDCWWREPDELFWSSLDRALVGFERRTQATAGAARVSHSEVLPLRAKSCDMTSSHPPLDQIDLVLAAMLHVEEHHKPSTHGFSVSTSLSDTWQGYRYLRERCDMPPAKLFIDMQPKYGDPIHGPYVLAVRPLLNPHNKAGGSAAYVRNTVNTHDFVHFKINFGPKCHAFCAPRDEGNVVGIASAPGGSCPSAVTKTARAHPRVEFLPACDGICVEGGLSRLDYAIRICYSFTETTTPDEHLHVLSWHFANLEREYNSAGRAMDGYPPGDDFVDIGSEDSEDEEFGAPSDWAHKYGDGNGWRGL